MGRVILFAKRPLLGRVKTRLAPALTAEGALALYEGFVADQVGFLRRLSARYEVELCVDEVWGDGNEHGGVRVALQGAGNLGERMLRAFRKSRDEGVEATVVIGADSPTLPADHLHRAFELLAGGKRGVIAPADDGGYVLLGLAEPLPELFREIDWGSSTVYETTRTRARQAGIDLALLPAWYDVDDAIGLERLRAELSPPEEERRAPNSARALDKLAR